MKVETFGNPNNPVALLIHSIFYPGITSYKTILPLLEDNYYVIVPNLNGLTYPYTEFVSQRKQAEDIIMWLKENNIGNIHFLLGSSYGSAIAFEILKEQSLQIDKATLDSPALKHSKLHGYVFYRQLKRVVDSAKKYGVDGLNKHDRYKYLSHEDKEYCIKVYENLDNKTMKKMSFSCYDYILPSQLYRKDTKVVFLFGENDKSKINLNEVKSLHSGEIRIIDGMKHMQLVFEKPLEFLQECGLDIL